MDDVFEESTNSHDYM